MQAVAVAQLANFALGDAGQLGQTGIGEALAFQGAQERFVQAVDARFGHLFFRAHQLFNLHREPAVDVGQVEDAVNRQTGAEGVGDVPDAVRAGVFQLAADLGQRFRIVGLTFGSKPVAPTSRPRSAFAATPAGCGRWPSLRRPTSSGWSGGRWRRRTSRS